MADEHPGVSGTGGSQRRNVTRACDECKRRKVKCDGSEFCSRCVTSNVEMKMTAHSVCTYNAAYNRVQGRHAPYPPRSRVSSSQDVDIPDTNASALLSPSSGIREIPQSTTSLPAAESSGIGDGGPAGDASVHGFLQKVSSHLAQVGHGLPRNLFKRHEEHSPQQSGNARTLVLPSKDTAKGYMDAYFEHGNATCRFLVPEDTYQRLHQLYTQTDQGVQSQIDMTIALLVIGTGCVWTASWKNEPVPPWRAKAYPFLRTAENWLEPEVRVYPPTLKVLQAQVLKCQCELVLGRFNSAWMSLGTAIRLSQMIDIQREQPSSHNILEAHNRRMLFWAMFMIDRYLSVILGRPVAINESDITVGLSSQLPERLASRLESREKKLMIGTVAHYRLVKIIGHTISRLYSGSNRDSTCTENTVTDLEEELKQWLLITPSFFHPRNSPHSDDDPLFYDVPWILKRQQRTVHSAFHFANMLIYRGYLLQEFLHQDPRSPDRVRKCVDNAMQMLKLAGEFGVDEWGYNGTFWITAHFIFCAISILLVYLTVCQDPEDRKVTENAVEAAMRFHRKLDNSASVSAQKLLDESRSRAEIVRNIQTPSSASAALISSSDTNRQPGEEGPSPSSIDDAGTTQDSLVWRTLWSQQQQVEDSMNGVGRDVTQQPATLPFATADHFDVIMDIGFDNTIFPDTFDPDVPFPLG